jgi:hypothetical protein
MERQAHEITLRMKQHELTGQELDDSTIRPIGFHSKGAIIKAYSYEMSNTSLERTLQRNQKRAAVGKSRTQVKFVGKITSEQAGEQVHEKWVEQMRLQHNRELHLETKERAEDQLLLDKT